MSTQLTFDVITPTHAPIIETPKSVTNPPRSLATITKDFQKTIQKLAYSRHVWQVWEDFCEMGALAISNALMFSDERESRYMNIVGGYDRDDVHEFPKLLGMVTEALETEYNDFLGQNFMDLNLGSKWVGQFFTPYHVCLAIAKIVYSEKDFQDKQIVTMNEPACGGGAMVIAGCQALREMGINFQNRVRVTAQDLSPTAAHMCYIQLSLIGCPAHVIVGDSLKVECRERYVTPMAAMQGWFN